MTFNNENKRDILIMVNFPNIDKIKDIQKKYYDIANKIEPHIAVAFPFNSEITDEELYNKLYEVLSKYKPFKIVCHGVSIPVGESNYRFLNIVENKDIIKNISDDIYKNIIPECLEYRNKYNYDPHISLVNKPLDEEIELDDTFEMIVDSLYVERIGDNDQSIKLYDIKLEK
ncbi:MAG: 2'-5' RNA ligase family protein [Clostridia bacterium]|nr:2'-5' RNA ligase family protein [Clostridia bacterium]